jgi:hypothetical protein
MRKEKTKVASYRFPVARGAAADDLYFLVTGNRKPVTVK